MLKGSKIIMFWRNNGNKKLIDGKSTDVEKRQTTVLFLLNAPALLNAPHEIFQERINVRSLAAVACTKMCAIEAL